MYSEPPVGGEESVFPEYIKLTDLSLRSKLSSFRLDIIIQGVGLAKNLQQKLRQMLNLTGVTAVCILSRDGFVVDYVCSTKTDLEAIGAVMASGFGTSEVIGTELSLGYLNQCILEYDTSKIIMASIGDNILAVITDGNAVIGQIRYNIQKSITEIVNVLS